MAGTILRPEANAGPVSRCGDAVLPEQLCVHYFHGGCGNGGHDPRAGQEYCQRRGPYGAVFYDITWVGVVGEAPSDRQGEIFKIVSEARDIGVKTVQDAVSSAKPIAGWEVDQAVRSHIKTAKYGDYFIHRTGHSIATEVHSNGANMDDLEIHDERRILPNSLFSIEPGIYCPEFCVSLEVVVLLRAGNAEATGKIQRRIG